MLCRLVDAEFLKTKSKFPLVKHSTRGCFCPRLEGLIPNNRTPLRKISILAPRRQNPIFVEVFLQSFFSSSRHSVQSCVFKQGKLSRCKGVRRATKEVLRCIHLEMIYLRCDGNSPVSRQKISKHLPRSSPHLISSARVLSLVKWWHFLCEQVSAATGRWSQWTGNNVPMFGINFMVEVEERKENSTPDTSRCRYVWKLRSERSNYAKFFNFAREKFLRWITKRNISEESDAENFTEDCRKVIYFSLHDSGWWIKHLVVDISLLCAILLQRNEWRIVNWNGSDGDEELTFRVIYLPAEKCNGSKTESCKSVLTQKKSEFLLRFEIRLEVEAETASICRQLVAFRILPSPSFLVWIMGIVCEARQVERIMKWI